MIVDVEVSMKLKNQFSRELSNCYSNTITLYNSKEIDAYVIGFITRDKKFFLRSAWGIKDNKIVDITNTKFNNNEYFYIPSLVLTQSNPMWYTVATTKNPALIGFDEEKENETIQYIKNTYGIDTIISLGY